MQQLKGFMYLLLATLLMGSCASVEKIPYFQDLNPKTHSAPSPISEVTLRAGDKISIIINSKDPQLATLFNLPTFSHQVGTQGVNSSYNYSGRISSYKLDSNGDIDFPILGKININGMLMAAIEQYFKPFKGRGIALLHMLRSFTFSTRLYARGTTDMLAMKKDLCYSKSNRVGERALSAVWTGSCPRTNTVFRGAKSSAVRFPHPAVPPTDTLVLLRRLCLKTRRLFLFRKNESPRRIWR